MAASSESLPKKERLAHRRDFQAVFRKGSRFDSRFLTLWITQGEGSSREIGIVTSRRIGRAVARNRARRLVKEAYRRNKGLLPPSVRVVVVVKRGAPEASYQEIEEALVRLLRRAIRGGERGSSRKSNSGRTHRTSGSLPEVSLAPEAADVSV